MSSCPHVLLFLPACHVTWYGLGIIVYAHCAQFRMSIGTAGYFGVVLEVSLSMPSRVLHNLALEGIHSIVPCADWNPMNENDAESGP